MANYLEEQHLKTLVADYLGPREREEDLVAAFYAMATGIRFRYFQDSISLVEDLIQDAVVTAISVADRFKPDRGSCFAYFTTVMINAMRASRNRYRRFPCSFSDFHL